MKATIMGVSIALALTAPSFASQPASRGDLMKTCLAEWKVKSKAPSAEKLKYTAFLSECLKRQNLAHVKG